MPLTVDIEKDLPKSADSHLVGCLLLYQYRQDQALGIEWYSKRVRSLLWYYLYLTHQQQTTLLQVAYLNGIIQEGAKEIKRLVAEVEEADDKQAIFQKVKLLEAAIKKAKEQYDLIIANTYSPDVTINM